MHHCFAPLLYVAGFLFYFGLFFFSRGHYMAFYFLTVYYSGALLSLRGRSHSFARRAAEKGTVFFLTVPIAFLLWVQDKNSGVVSCFMILNCGGELKFFNARICFVISTIRLCVMKYAQLWFFLCYIQKFYIYICLNLNINLYWT